MDDGPLSLGGLFGNSYFTGSLRALGGFGLAAGGAAACVYSAGLGCGAGAVAFASGVDNMFAGYREARTGRYTYSGVERLGMGFGLTPEEAAYLDLGVSVASGIGAGRALLGAPRVFPAAGEVAGGLAARGGVRNYQHQAGEIASSAAQRGRLATHLGQLERYGQAGVRDLQSGRIRYYGQVDAAQKPGEMAGRRLVREWDPATDRMRTWHETLDTSGRVRIVRPETGGPKRHFLFDREGNFVREF